MTYQSFNAFYPKECNKPHGVDVAVEANLNCDDVEMTENYWRLLLAEEKKKWEKHETNEIMKIQQVANNANEHCIQQIRNQYEAVLEQLQNANDELKSKCSALQKQSDNVSEELSTARKQHQVDLEDCGKWYTSLVSEKEATVGRLKLSESRLVELVESLQNEINNIRSETYSAETTQVGRVEEHLVVSNKACNKSVNSEVDCLSNSEERLSSNTDSCLIEKICVAVNTDEFCLHEQCEQALDEMKQLLKSKVDMNEVVAMRQEYEARLLELGNRACNYQQEWNDVTTTFDITKNELFAANETFNTSTTEVLQRDGAMEMSSNNKFKTLLKENDHLLLELKEINRKYSTLADEYNASNKEIETITNKYSVLLAEQDTLKNEFGVVSIKYDKSMEMLNEANFTLKEINEKYDALLEEYSATKCVVIDLNNRNRALQEEENASKYELESLNQRSYALKNELAVKSLELEIISNKYQTLLEEKDVLYQEQEIITSKYNEQLDRNELKNEFEQNDFDALKSTYEVKLASLEEELCDIKTKLIELETTKKTYDLLIADMKAELIALKTQLSEKITRLNEANEKCSANEELLRRKFEEELDQCNSQYETNQDSLVAKYENMLTEFRQRLETTSSLFAHEQETANKIKDNYELQINKTKDNYELQINKMKDNYELHINELTENYEKCKVDYDSKVDEINIKLSKIAEEYEEKISNLNSEITVLKNSYELQLADSNNKLSLLEAEHELKVNKLVRELSDLKLFSNKQITAERSNDTSENIIHAETLPTEVVS